MSSSKKKSSKGDKIPKPINIKKEKTEEERTLQPISHYLDDRLELNRQIFATLKPKTILNLAPEFLKKTPLEEIEGLCLEELLCLSKKRLKSIIEDTRCPTDTDSSDEDSDVERKEEHISLEEISSDSDIGGKETRKAKKKKLGSNKTDETKEPTGQISVLELLELQARARAIRSQLAMEPITKIEVKSDDSSSEEKPATESAKKLKEKRKRKSSEQTQRKEPNPAADISVKVTATSKKIKIKRNYRQSTKSPEKEQVELKKDAPKSRSASPDVIPIQTEPETLLISDSTDDEGKEKTKEVTEPQPKVAVAPTPAEPMVESEPEEGEVRDEPEKIEEKTKEEEIETAQPEETPEAAPEEQQNLKTSELPVVEDEDQNDDVISIGGDLEHEMIEELAKEDEPKASVKSERNETQTQEDVDNDVISLDTSEDERDKMTPKDSESWRTRYLKSSKVSQVLAESRLAKRVRDKIKKSKRAQKHGKDPANDSTEKPAASSSSSDQPQFNSKHEDGSVEQYQELLQHRQRKSSNNDK